MIRTPQVLIALLSVAASSSMLACPQLPEQNNSSTDPTDPSNSSTPTPSPGNQQPGDNGATNNAPLGGGAQQYAKLCAGCHGPMARGGIGPALHDWSRGRGELVSLTRDTMPTQDPNLCDQACAEAIADYLLAGVTADPGCGDDVHPARRSLRLLNRREYTNTLNDVFAGYLGDGKQAAPELCMDVADCALGEQVCSENLCVARPCQTRTFIFDPGGRQVSSVHVAGSFNGWPATLQEGGLSMRWLPGVGVWYAEQDLSDARYEYKFVIDESEWIADPANPDGSPDGFGGQNSVLTVACEAGAASSSVYEPRDWGSALPNERRQEYFSFDHSIDTLVVTNIHLDAYLDNAEAVGELVAENYHDIVTCAAEDRACAEALVDELAPRAFRRPITSAQRTRYVDLILDEPDFTHGVEVAARVIFSSPYFLYRFEVGQDTEDGTARLDGYEIASSMSYMFWGTAPDAELLAAAESGMLDTPAGRRAQATRLIDDPRARPALAQFAWQWLGVDTVTGAAKNAQSYPEFDRQLAASMLQETAQLFLHVTFDQRGGVGDLFEADYSFINRELAELYGLDASGFTGVQRVMMPEGRRAGVLGHASVMARYAHSDQTSPILRGLFVRSHLLCQEFPEPPANVGNVPEVDANATTRERFRQHADDPACSSCHVFIDEVGFGFEHFDPIGRWRDTELGQPIDATGDVRDVEELGAGTHAEFGDLGELGRILAQSESAKRCLTTHVYRYGHGYKERAQDHCAIERLHEDAAGRGGSIRETFISLVEQPSFVIRD